LMFGSSMDKMENAMEAGLRAATNSGDLISIGAMNFGGEFGSYEYHLHDLLEA
jgi:formylmethanofuran:tetrahydromethanopterin formyltransferase